MALSPAEKQKRYRERQKSAKKTAADLANPFLRTPFFEWLADNEHGDWSTFTQEIMAAGFEPPSFHDDSGPRSLDGAFEQAAPEIWAGYEGSIGRVETIVQHLLTSAELLAMVINQYKLAEIDARISEIERADLSSPEVKAKALQDIVALQKIRAQLDGKTFRRAFSEISVKGTSSD